MKAACAAILIAIRQGRGTGLQLVLAITQLRDTPAGTLVSVSWPEAAILDTTYALALQLRHAGLRPVAGNTVGES